MEEKAPTDDKRLYHERQVKELCALHALNNLFQTKQAFTKKELDEICNRLSPDSFINPHKSVLGLGNYDVNVLMAALQEKGFETIWFDKRKDVDVLKLKNIMGLILNTPTDYKLGFMKLPLHRKHWIAIKCLNGQYMNLDSKLDAPYTIGDESRLVQFLRSELSNGEKELLLVVDPMVYEKSLWRRDPSKEDSSFSLSSNKVLSDVNNENVISPHSAADDHSINNGVDEMNNTTISDKNNGNCENENVTSHVKSKELIIEDATNSFAKREGIS